MKIDALVDSNVIIAALAGEHEHHVASADLFDRAGGATLALPRTATPKPIAR